MNGGKSVVKRTRGDRGGKRKSVLECQDTRGLINVLRAPLYCRDDRPQGKALGIKPSSNAYDPKPNGIEAKHSKPDQIAKKSATFGFGAHGATAAPRPAVPADKDLSIYAASSFNQLLCRLPASIERGCRMGGRACCCLLPRVSSALTVSMSLCLMLC